MPHSNKNTESFITPLNDESKRKGRGRAVMNEWIYFYKIKLSGPKKEILAVCMYQVYSYTFGVTNSRQLIV